MIRSARVADAADAGALKVRAWRAAYGGFMRTAVLAALDPAQETMDWREYLGPAAAEIYGLYLDPPLVGTGLGRQLFTHAVADLQDRGRSPTCVYAYEPNRRAITFYERAGFRADGVTRLDEEDGTGVAEIRLVLS